MMAPTHFIWLWLLPPTKFISSIWTSSKKLLMSTKTLVLIYLCYTMMLISMSKEHWFSKDCIEIWSNIMLSLISNRMHLLISLFISSPNWYNKVMLGIEIENIYKDTFYFWACLNSKRLNLFRIIFCINRRQ